MRPGSASTPHSSSCSTCFSCRTPPPPPRTQLWNSCVVTGPWLTALCLAGPGWDIGSQKLVTMETQDPTRAPGQMLGQLTAHTVETGVHRAGRIPMAGTPRTRGLCSVKKAGVMYSESLITTAKRHQEKGVFQPLPWPERLAVVNSRDFIAFDADKAPTALPTLLVPWHCCLCSDTKQEHLCSVRAVICPLSARRSVPVLLFPPLSGPCLLGRGPIQTTLLKVGGLHRLVHVYSFSHKVDYVSLDRRGLWTSLRYVDNATCNIPRIWARAPVFSWILGNSDGIVVTVAFVSTYDIPSA
ncbi:hypothetical protein CB1_000849046 [Camelus ferus]|nr:hypothetical protein CB1_000849046 [Camelus ferus]